MLGKKETVESDRSGELNTVIGKGTVIEGLLTVQNSLRVDGRVQGQVQASDSLVVGKDGEIEGEVKARNAIIGGRVKNRILATGKVVLEAHAVVHGEIKTGKLVIDEGAVFDGNCAMSENGRPLALPENGKSEDRSRVFDFRPRQEAMVAR
jgi:cytoskeletal protein CcmA (bactofilin family)